MAKRRNETTIPYNRDKYLYGNTVRKFETLPKRQEEDLQKNYELRNRTRKNREKALQMNFGYVLFLAIATVITLVVCIGYLRLQSDITNRISNIASLESELSDIKSQNDEEYNRVMTSVDLEYIKKVAIEDLGMVYAGEEQVVLYSSKDSDYVRQYEDLPTEESSSLLGRLN